MILKVQFKWRVNRKRKVLKSRLEITFQHFQRMDISVFYYPLSEANI